MQCYLLYIYYAAVYLPGKKYFISQTLLNFNFSSYHVWAHITNTTVFILGKKIQTQVKPNQPTK